MISLSVIVPLATKTANWWLGAGTRGGRFVRATRARMERQTTWLLVRKALHEHGRRKIDSAFVTITAVRSRLMDDDAVPICVKHVRDGVACAISGRKVHDRAPDGVNDPYSWKAFQMKTDRGQKPYVEIKISEREA